MPTPPTFDLTAALVAWRARLASYPAFKQDNLDELESHVREALPTLTASGLSPGEAFLVATYRVGPPQEIQGEFAKVNESTIWAGRLGWVLTGALLTLVLVPLSNLVMFLVFVFSRHLFAARPLENLAPIVVTLCLETLFVFAVARLFRRRSAALFAQAQRLFSRPLWTAVCIFALLVATGELGRHFYGVDHFEHGFIPGTPSIPEAYNYTRIFLLSVEAGGRPFHSVRLIQALLRFTPQLALAITLAIVARREVRIQSGTAASL